MNRWIWAGALTALVMGGAAMAQQAKPGALVEVGAEASGFRLNDQEGKAVRLADFRGKNWVVLAFYPKALTGG